MALVASILPEIAPREAAFGDVAVTAEGVLCVVQGRLLIGVGDGAITSTPRSHAVRAFRVL